MTRRPGLLPTTAAPTDLPVAYGAVPIPVDKLVPSPWNPNHTHPPGGLDEWYRTNVIGGTGAFLLSVMGFDTFAYAMVNKLSRETS